MSFDVDREPTALWWALPVLALLVFTGLVMAWGAAALAWPRCRPGGSEP